MHQGFRAAAISAIVISISFFISCSAGGERRSANSDPTRPLVTPQAAASRPKIVAFGDSLTAGFGLTERESYPYLLQERLDAEGYNYEVVNAGVSGETSLGGLERVDWVLEQDNVEILILELGANDLLRSLPPARMKDNLDKIITKAKAKNIDVLLCGMIAPPNMGADYQREFSNAFPDLAEEHDIRYVPFLLQGIALEKDLNQADGIHPNPAGTRMMMENIYRELRPMLKK